MKAAHSEISSAEAVAGEVRAWMGRRQCSTRSAALELGWTETYLGRRLAGKIPFNVNELMQVADLLEVPVSAFFDIPTWLKLTGPAGQGVRKQDNRPPRRHLASAA